MPPSIVPTYLPSPLCLRRQMVATDGRLGRESDVAFVQGMEGT